MENLFIILSIIFKQLDAKFGDRRYAIRMLDETTAHRLHFIVVFRSILTSYGLLEAKRFADGELTIVVNNDRDAAGLKSLAKLAGVGYEDTAVHNTLSLRQHMMSVSNLSDTVNRLRNIGLFVPSSVMILLPPLSLPIFASATVMAHQFAEITDLDVEELKAWLSGDALLIVENTAAERKLRCAMSLAKLEAHVLVEQIPF